ncbi:MAG: hypothetical protein U1G07_14465 [Verrucomicrobiota bacterium]
MNAILPGRLGSALFALALMWTAPLTARRRTRIRSSTFGQPPPGAEFETGMLRGALHAGGKSLGLTSVTHLPSGRRIDASNGLFSHYRIFTQGTRYGGGAWDWPATARLASNGVVDVHWLPASNRPFDLAARYRLRAPDVVEVETTVLPSTNLPSFESFLASYFSDGFTNSAVYVETTRGDQIMACLEPVLAAHGIWQVFPRDEGAVKVLRDGRWRLPPNPVEWTVGPRLSRPLAVRREPTTGLSVVLLSDPAECFAVASPHQSEPHRSVYFSLFGRDLAAGRPVTATARLWITMNPTVDEIRQKEGEFRQPPP